VRAFILDASMAVAWFLPSAPHDTTALEKRALLDERVALVPTIWRAEIVNFVSREQVSGSISQAEAVEELHQMVLLSFGVVDDPSPGELLSLSTQFRLTSHEPSTSMPRCHPVSRWRRSTPRSSVLRARPEFASPDRSLRIERKCGKAERPRNEPDDVHRLVARPLGSPVHRRRASPGRGF
jgi:predicted nucleic acid-binding protein